MANYDVTIGDSGTFNLVHFWYQQTLNGITSWEVALDGVNSTQRAEITTGADVTVYRDTTLICEGVIQEIKNMQGGGMIVSGFNQEVQLAQIEGPTDAGKKTKTWTSTNDDTIFGDLITQAGGTWASDVSGSTATNVSAFRTSESMSVWECIMQLIRLTDKDLAITQGTPTALLKDRQGSNNAFTFNEGVDIGNISFREQKAKASQVIVYGKGDGENQIKGSSGSGTPVVKIVDRNILNITEANNRATKELALISASTKQYRFNVYDVTKSVSVGDRGNLTANSLGLHNSTVDIVSLTRGVSTKGIETLSVEVTNSAYRMASRSQQESKGASKSNYLVSQSAMQGSGNLSQWAGRINANDTYPLRIPFYVGDKFEDEAGNLRINSMTLDYDVDKYRKEVGTATDTGHDHTLSASGSTVVHKHDPSDDGHLHGVGNMTSTEFTTMSDEGSDNFFNDTLSIGWNNNQMSETIIGTFDFIYVRVVIKADFSLGDFDVAIKIHVDGNYYVNRWNQHADTSISTSVIRETFIFPIFASVNTDVYVDVYSSVNRQYDGWLQVHGGGQSHDHSIASHNVNSGNSAVDDNNRTPDLSGNSDSDSASVNIGDDVSDAGSINATSVDIHLDFWNTGTSTWDLDKHTILNTGATLDTDVDITDSGTYPDAKGTWRIRIVTDHTDPDLINGIVNIKHAMDN